MRASQGGCAGSNHAGTEQHGTDDRGARKQIVPSDGTRLSVYEHGDRANPTILAVRGYLDDHSVWDGVVDALAGESSRRHL